VQSLKAATTRQSLSDSTPTLLNAHAEDTIPLKLALFNLSKYVREEDFAVEFMSRGGMGTLMRLLERKEGGLTGNSLAVSPDHFPLQTVPFTAREYLIEVDGGYSTLYKVYEGS
jgi:hypothetical protein